MFCSVDVLFSCSCFQAEPTALLIPSAEPIAFGDETVNKAVYATEFSQRVSTEVVQRLAGLQSRGHAYLGDALRAWRAAFNKLSVSIDRDMSLFVYKVGYLVAVRTHSQGFSDGIWMPAARVRLATWVAKQVGGRPRTTSSTP